MTIISRLCTAIYALMIMESIFLECSEVTLQKNITKSMNRRISRTAGSSGFTGNKLEPSRAMLQRPRAAGFATNVGSPPVGYADKFGTIRATGRTKVGINSIHGGIGAVRGQVDFNPALAGYYGNAGIKIRVNQRGFQYATALASQILDREIVRARIPDINQQITEIPGRLTICNLHISNYRPPQCLQIYPAPPNLIVLKVEDFDVGVSGNLDGVINLLLPIKLFGIIHAYFYHVSATVTLAIERSPYGTLHVVVCGCNVDLPYADVCIQCGGLIGDLANAFLRRQISERIRSMVPNQICEMLPEIINERVNSLLARIPQSIPISQMAPVFAGFLRSSVPPHCNSPQCQMLTRTTTLPPLTLNNSSAVSPPKNPPAPAFDENANRNVASAAPIQFKIPTSQSQMPNEKSVGSERVQTQVSGSNVNNEVDDFGNMEVIADKGASDASGSKLQERKNMQPLGKYNVEQQQIVASGQPLHKTSISPNGRSKREAAKPGTLSSKKSNSPGAIARSKISSGLLQLQQQTAERGVPSQRQQQQKTQIILKFRNLKKKAKLLQSSTSIDQLPSRQITLNSSAFVQHKRKSVLSSGIPDATVPLKLVKAVLRGVPITVSTKYSMVGVNSATVGRAVSDPCAGCPSSGSFSNFGSFITQQLDLRKVFDLALTVQVVQTCATFYDFSVDLNGEFSPMGQGGTPFRAFPMQWPTLVGAPMVEILISDFTINSLFYWMHRRNFLSLHIGPQTPGIGPLLVTTCDSDEDYFEEDINGEILLYKLTRLRERRRYHFHHQQRIKRQAIGGNSGTGGSSGDGLGNLADLSDFNLCIGKIMPAINEKYPNRTLSIFVHTRSAPSIILNTHMGGTVRLDLMLDADVYLDRTNIKIGTIAITIQADIVTRIMGNRIFGNLSLPILRLSNPDQTFGLEQDAFNNLANLAKDTIVSEANQQLSKGIPIPIPTSNLPINIINPQIRIMNRGIYIGSDFTISPPAFKTLS